MKVVGLRPPDPEWDIRDGTKPAYKTKEITRLPAIIEKGTSQAVVRLRKVLRASLAISQKISDQPNVIPHDCIKTIYSNYSLETY